MSKNVIIWVEDRPDTVSEQIDFCRKQGFEVSVVATAFRLADILKSDMQRLCLIVLDVMLFNIMSLDDIGIPNSLTEGGYSAGWVLIDRFLRPGLTPDQEQRGYPEIPILILSTRILSATDEDRLKELKQRGGQGIEYIEKGGIYDSGKHTWTEKFTELINKIPH